MVVEDRDRPQVDCREIKDGESDGGPKVSSDNSKLNKIHLR